MSSNEKLTDYKSDKNKTIFYRNNKKEKLVYKNDKVEVTTYYMYGVRKTGIKQVEIRVQKNNYVLKRTTKYYMSTKIESSIDTDTENIDIKYDYKNGGKKITQIIKSPLDKTDIESQEIHFYYYQNSHCYKKIILYSGKYVKEGVGKRVIEYDENGNIIFNKDNIEYYNELLNKNKKLEYKPIKIFNDDMDKLYPNLLKETEDSEFNLKNIKNLLKESLNINLDCGPLMKEHYLSDDTYDLPFKFASAVYNTYAQKNSAYIKIKTPEIFKDIDENEIFENFNKLSLYCRNSEKFLPKNSVIKLKLGTKNFECISLGKGFEGNVFRICYKDSEPVIFKIYHADNKKSVSGIAFASLGLYGSMSILREANLANVKDIITLYYANPIYIPIGKDKGYIQYVGGWQITQDAETIKYKEQGLKFIDWIISHGLTWLDNRDRNWINEVIIDPGATKIPREENSFNNRVGNDEINFIYSRYVNGETTQQIIDFLNKKS